MNPCSRLRNSRRQAGMSLVEVLIASLLIFFIFLSILPLFGRAKISNRRGGEASQMVNFLTSNLEEYNQSTVNHSSFNDQFSSQEELEEEDEANSNEQGQDPLEEHAVQLTETDYFSNTTNYIGLSTRYWGTGPRDSLTEADAVLGDERWLSRNDAASHPGLILWFKDLYLFNWDLSDVNAGTISVAGVDSDGNPLDEEVVTVGHPKRFDNPLKWSQDNPPDIREIRVFVRSGISSSPLGTGPAMVLGYYRSF